MRGSWRRWTKKRSCTRTCPVSTGGGTRRVQSVRERGKRARPCRSRPSLVLVRGVALAAPRAPAARAASPPPAAWRGPSRARRRAARGSTWDETCPVSTGRKTRRVQLVREKDETCPVSTGRKTRRVQSVHEGGGGGGGGGSGLHPPREKLSSSSTWCGAARGARGHAVRAPRIRRRRRRHSRLPRAPAPRVSLAARAAPTCRGGHPPPPPPPSPY